MAEKEEVGVRLLDGPLAPFTALYPMQWPPPDEIVVIEHEGRLSLVVNPEHFDEAIEDMGGQRYRKTAQSALTAAAAAHPRVARGAAYLWIDPET